VIAWDDIPMSIKLTVPAVTAVVGAIGWMFVTFETVAASEQKWQYHNQAITCRTVYELEHQVQTYMERLRFDQSLTSNDRTWIKEQIAQLQQKINRLDPKGVC
jgi:hypothetical protein